MTETTGKEKKGRLGLSRPGKLVLNKTIEAGQVRQSFSRGRSKAVTVEVRKKRTYLQDADGRLKKVGAEEEGVEAAPAGVEPVEIDHAAEDAAQLARVPNLTEEEKAARLKALHDARKADEEARQLAAREAEERAVREAEEAKEAAARAEREAAERAEQEARRESEAKTAEPEDEAKPLPVDEAAPVAAPVIPVAPPDETLEAQVGPRKPDKAKVEVEDEDDALAKSRRGAPKVEVKRPAAPGKRGGERRRRAGKLTIAEALSEDEERTRSLASVRRAREKERQKRRTQGNEPQKVIRDVIIPETITVQELANRMAVRGVDVVKTLMRMGVMVTATQTIDADTAEVVATEFGHNIKRVSDADVEIGLKGEEDAASSLRSRAPVVTVMGHVDHGKTSLLDAMRETDVAGGEAGGITQHIGAYQVTTKAGHKITFIDTPGHAAFTDMRARGARVTDIVVLVVAADDGIMPQTIEAISHAKAAGVPIIVAINKMDLPGADPQRVRNDLLQHEVLLEEVGGDVLAVEVSAKKRINLDKLEEAILLQAEVLDLKANPDRPAEGAIIEAKVEAGRGSVATVLVQRGTLKVGDVFVAGEEWGRVRALVDAYGSQVDAAGPSVPVEVLGLSSTPGAGDDFIVVENDQRAREISEYRQGQSRKARVQATGRVSLEQMFLNIGKGQTRRLPIVLKADVHGSVEAISTALRKMATEEVAVDILHAGVGAINQSDVTLAKASDALIIGFNVRANAQSRDLAQREKLEIRYYSIIYNLIDDLKQALSGMLAPTLRENLLGYAEIREVFSITKVGKVAGCMVTEGVVRRGAKVRLLRDHVVIHEGSLSQLKRFKDDVREVKDGMECGMAFANYQDIQVGDFIECFDVEEVAREL
ncbi:MAG: translation initiation factor IF-2 [Rhodospirillales bacterium]|jgi:translation initiation factor IF-2|nr:translation initiation factor IF-2 [Rhodospirillales bacterium]